VKSLRHDPGYWLCALLLILFPPFFLYAVARVLWEDRQRRKWQLARQAECAGNHRIERDPTWDIYPDLRHHEYYCRICGEPGEPEQAEASA
jgi:hypothetical protein